MIITRSLSVGGAERQLSALANGLSRRGFDVVVAVLYAGGALESELSAGSVRLECVGKLGKWDPGVFLLRLGKLVRSAKPGVLLGFLPVGNIVATAVAPLASDARLIWSVRASRLEYGSYGWRRSAVFHVSTLLSRQPDAILLNSRAGLDAHALKGYPRNKMTVIHNGIDTSRFRPDVASGVRLRRHWGIAHDEFLVGFAGRSDPVKNLPLFLEAIAIVRADQPDVRAVCVCPGTEKHLMALRGRVATMGLDPQVRVLGTQEDMAAFYNATDALCLTSSSEAFPNVVGEAMACGTPCVVTDVGDCAVIVGKTGVVVDEISSDSLARGVIDLRHQIRCGTLESSRDRIVAEFGLERMLDETEPFLC